jgi:hypothetical protein
VYEFSDSDFANLRIREYTDANLEWLEFVGANRKGPEPANDFNLIIGPVANDSTMPVLRLYFGGVYTAKEAIARLQTQNLVDQYTFKTHKSLQGLRFLEAVAV